jgi:putative endonuclease
MAFKRSGVRPSLAPQITRFKRVLHFKMENDKSNTPGFVYILQSTLNLRYYIGSTIDIEKRITEHEKGYVKSTKNLRPLELRFFKKFDDISYARKIEYKIKKMKSKNLIDRIDIKMEV